MNDKKQPTEPDPVQVIDTSLDSRQPVNKMTMSQLLEALEVNQVAVTCHGVAYERLKKIAEQAANPELVSIPGLPILMWSTGHNGEMVTIETDLANVDRQFIHHVVSPLCNAHAVSLKAAMDYGKEIREAINSIIEN